MSRAANTAYAPYRSNQRSALPRLRLPTSASTGARPRTRAMPKEMAAASAALAQLGVPPQNVPKASPLAKPRIRDGIKAASACNTIRAVETTGAQAPYERM